MITGSCKRESELLDAVNAGCWPHSTESELVDHAQSCDDCSEVATVASALLRDRRAMESRVNVPPSGAVWWRMQMRQQRDAREAAANAVQRVHAVVVTTIFLAIAAAFVLTPALRRGATWFFTTTTHDFAPLLAAPMPSTTVMMLIGVVCVIFTPVALYLALAHD